MDKIQASSAKCKLKLNHIRDEKNTLFHVNRIWLTIGPIVIVMFDVEPQNVDVILSFRLPHPDLVKLW